MSNRLSKSAIENHRRCARCFWLEKSFSLKQPQGIKSGLPMGMDRVLKEHYDRHRAHKVMPAEIAAQLPGWTLFEDQAKLRDIRNWRKGLAVEFPEGAVLSTALDDIIYHPERQVFAMLDYKTKAKMTNKEDTEKYYSTQSDCYDLALSKNGYPTAGVSFFAYYYPISVGERDGDTKTNEFGTAPLAMTWECQVIEIAANHERAKKYALEASSVMNSAEAPNSSPSCEVCNYITDRAAIGKKLAASTK